MGPSSVSDEPWGPKLALGCILMSLLKLPAAWFQLFVIYLAPDINFRCDTNTTNSVSLSFAYTDNICFKSLHETKVIFLVLFQAQIILPTFSLA